MAKELPQDDIFNPDNKMESGKMQWGKIGDYIVGTYVGSKTLTYDDGKKGTVYELIVERGEYHSVARDESGNMVTAAEPTVLVPGETVRMNGKAGVDDDMKKIKLGQKVGLRFESLGKLVAGKSPFKNVATYPGIMDEAYLATQQGVSSLDDIGAAPFA